MVSIANVITVSLLPEGQAAALDNLNVVSIITTDRGGPLNSSNRYGLYTDSASVEADFGTASAASAAARVFFATQPNPVSAGGVLVMGYWRATSETVPAKSAALTGAQLNEITVIDAIQNIQNGSFDITVNGTLASVAGLDFRTVSSLTEVAALIDTALVNATVSYVGNQFVVKSTTTGITSTITFASTAAGTYVGNILGLASGSGASLAQGAASVVLTAETQLDAITALKSLVNIKGATFIDPGVDADRTTLAAWASANSVLIYEVFSLASNLNIDPTNPVWAIKLAGHKNYRMLYSKAGNRMLAVTYMARVHVVNFSAENSAMTIHLKTLSVAAEDYSQTEVSKAKAVGLDIYTTIKDVSKVLTSGKNGFVDNQYNLIGFVDAIQIGQLNLLGGTSTKISQRDKGVNQIVDQAEKDCARFVRADVFGSGEWTSPDYFGDYDTFTRNIREKGYYVLAGLLRNQPQSERQERKSPVIQIAVKNSGAIHSVDLIINFNE